MLFPFRWHTVVRSAGLAVGRLNYWQQKHYQSWLVCRHCIHNHKESGSSPSAHASRSSSNSTDTTTNSSSTMTNSSPKSRSVLKEQLQSKLDSFRGVCPGLMLSVSVAGVGFLSADYMGHALLASQGIDAAANAASPISGIPIAIILGLIVNNNPFLKLSSDTFAPGLKFCSTNVLRAGIVLVGTKLSLMDVMTTGQQGIPVVMCAIGAGLLYIPWASRLAGLSDRMGALLAAGTSICGVTAITALAPAIKATSKETAVSVANVVLFGTLGMLMYPYLLNHICVSSEHVGMVLGVAIHDTSQVLGGALTYKEIYSDELAFQVAAITKLTRNVFLAGVIPALTYLHVLKEQPIDPHGGNNNSPHTSETDAFGDNRSSGGGIGSSTSHAKGSVDSSATQAEKKESAISGLATFQKYVPSFLLGFIGVATIRTGIDMYLLESVYVDPVLYKKAIKFLGDDCSKVCLGAAMASVGLSTAKESLEGVGMKPFLVGGSGAMVVGGTGFAMASILA